MPDLPISSVPLVRQMTEPRMLPPGERAIVPPVAVKVHRDGAAAR